MKKLMLGLMMAFAVTVARAEVKTNVQIGDLIYSLDTESKTATITDYDYWLFVHDCGCSFAA